MAVNLKVLKTIKNYAVGEGVTPSYIYKLVKEGRMRLIMVDGIKFVDVSTYPTIPVTNRRK
jgi:hypothetical protein